MKLNKRYSNKGYQAEQEAGIIFKELFDNVKRTNYHAFYDYLVSKGTLDIRIDVKYYDMKDSNYGYIIFPDKQFRKLLSYDHFLIYFTSNKGSCFLTPKQILEHAHIHHYELNPNHIKIVVRIKYVDGQLKIDEPKKCRFCLGKIKNKESFINKRDDMCEVIEMHSVQA